MNAAGQSRQPVFSDREVAAPPADGLRPAGFWRRALAYGIDWLLISPLLAGLLGAPIGAAWAAMLRLNALLQDWLLDRLLNGAGAMPSPLALANELMQDAPLLASVDALLLQLARAVTQAMLLAAAMAGLYFIGFEASPWQATPGKRWLDLKVVDLQGARIGWRRAGVRFLAGGLSWLSLNLGHALAGWRTDGRALHDLIAGARVVRRSPIRRRSGDLPE